MDAVDVVVSPCVNQNLSGFPLVLGNDNIERLCRRLRPAVLVPLTNAEFESEGALSGAIKQVGSMQEAEKRAGLADVLLKVPAPPGEPMRVQL